jgi:hypothetical protein
MACLNFKNGPKNGLGPLGVKKKQSGQYDFFYTTPN